MYFSNASGRYSTSDFRVGTFSPQLIRRPKMKRSLVNNLLFKNQFFSVTSKKPKSWVRIGTLKSVTYVFKKKHHRKNFKSFFLVFYPHVWVPLSYTKLIFFLLKISLWINYTLIGSINTYEFCGRKPWTFINFMNDVLNNRIVDILKIPSGAPFLIDTVSPDEARWAPWCPPLACPRADPLLMLPRLTQFHSNKHSIAWSETTAAAPNAGLKIWNSTKIIFFSKIHWLFRLF